MGASHELRNEVLTFTTDSYSVTSAALPRVLSDVLPAPMIKPLKREAPKASKGARLESNPD